MNLTQRLFFLGLLSLLPAVAVVLYLQIELRSAREAEARDLVSRQTVQAESEFGRVVEGIRTLLVAVASAPAVQTLDNRACSEFLRRLREGLPHVRGIAVMDLDGDLHCVSRMTSAQLNYADRPYFQEAIAKRQFVIGTYTVSKRNDGGAFLPFASPIFDEAGQIKGVAVASLDVEYFNAELKKWALGEGSALTIADREGVILARTPFPERFVGTKIPDAFMTWVHADRPGTEEALSQDGTRRIISYVPAMAGVPGIYLSTGISKDVAFAYVDQATCASLIIMIGGILAMLACIWWAGRYFIRRPVDRLLKLADGWSTDPPSPPTVPDDRSEFGEIGKALNRMGQVFAAQRQREKEHQDRQRLLLTEMNHRVKNMQTVVQAVVNQGLRASEVDRETRAKIETRLMALARSHDLLTKENWEGSSLRELVQQTLEPFGLVDERSHRFDIDGEPVHLTTRQTVSLGMALHELATNAVKYGSLSVERGVVAIGWTVVGNAGGRQLRLTWRERNGPLVALPVHQGFGSRLIERGLARELDGRVSVRFVPSGLECDIEVPLLPDPVSDELPSLEREQTA